jgi:hypothetical protein
MFENYAARLALRATLAAVIAALAATGAALVGDESISPAEGVAIAGAFFTAIGTWVGVGAVTPAEPGIGVK